MELEKGRGEGSGNMDGENEILEGMGKRKGNMESEKGDGTWDMIGEQGHEESEGRTGRGQWEGGKG